MDVSAKKLVELPPNIRLLGVAKRGGCWAAGAGEKKCLFALMGFILYKY